MKHPTMTSVERFFWLNAGYAYDPTKETKAQGRRRRAEQLARAEHYASNLGWTFEWSNDEFTNHQKEFGYTPQTCECCTLYDVTGNEILASLGCIDDATPQYRRVIQAELASEALVSFDKETETIDAH